MLMTTTLLSNRAFEQTLRNMDGSSHQFYLTGSRFFGNHRPTSDYDFFVDEGGVSLPNLGAISFLESNGFSLIGDYSKELDYKDLDPSIVGIYRKCGDLGSSHQWQIDVQVLKQGCALKKEKFQQHILGQLSNLRWWLSLSRAEKTAWWGFVATL